MPADNIVLYQLLLQSALNTTFPYSLVSIGRT